MSLNALLLFLASLAWASQYLFTSWAEQALPPITLTAAATAFAALALLPVAGLVLRRPLLATLRARPWLPMVMALTAVALPNIGTTIAEDSISADLASLVGTTVPILTILLAVFVTRQEPYSHLRLLGVAVAFAGMLVFVGPADLGTEETQLAAMLIMMSGGAVFALNGLLADAKGNDLDSVALTFWVMLFGTLALALAAATLEADQVTMPGLPEIGSVAGSGILGTGVGFLAYYLLIDRAGPSYAANYAYLVPPLGLACGVVFQGESVTATHVGGVALTLIGLWLLTRRDRTRPERISSDRTTDTVPETPQRRVRQIKTHRKDDKFLDHL